MKKKIALLLAAVMTFAAVVVPSNVFASTSNAITRNYPNATEGRLVTNNSAITLAVQSGAGTELLMRYSANPSGYNQAISINLENAYLSYFNDKDNYEDWSGYYMPVENATDDFPTYDTSKGIATLNDDTEMVYYTNVSSFKVAGTAAYDLDDDFASGWQTLINRSLSREGAFAVVSATPADNELTLHANSGDVPYLLTINPNDGGSAILTVLNVPVNTNLINVPLNFVITADEAVTLTTDLLTGSDITKINTPITIVSGAGASSVSFASVSEGRDTINLAPLTFVEKDPGTFVSGFVFLRAPFGYKFESTNITVSHDPMSGIASATATVANTATTTSIGLVSGGGYKIIPSSTVYGSADSISKLPYTAFAKGEFVAIPVNVTSSQSRVGRITISGLQLKAASSTAFGEVGQVTLYGAKNIQFGGITTAADGTQVYTAYNNTDYNNMFGTAAVNLNSFFGSDVTKPKDANLVSTYAAKSIDAVKRVDYGVALTTTTDPVTFYAGVESAKVASVKLAETAPLSIWKANDTTLSLVDKDGNSLAESVVFDTITTGNVSTFNLTNNTAYTFKDAADKYFNGNGSVFTIPHMEKAESDASKSASLPLSLKLTASVTFTGDIYVKAGGRSLLGMEVAPVLVATVLSPVEAIANTSNVEIGYQKIAIEDITVKETKAGLWTLGSVYFDLAAFGELFNDFSFVDVNSAKATMVAGDGLISGVTFSGKGNANFVNIAVTRVSSKTPFEIKLSGLYLRTDRTIPEGNYDLWIKGTAFDHVKHKAVANGHFELPNYIKVKTPGANKALTKNVAIDFTNPGTAKVEGQAFDMTAAPSYIDVDTGRTMLSIKYIAVALGIEAKNVMWDDTTRTVTIITTERTVRFFIGKNYYTINGAEQYMKDANGVFSYAVIVNDRSFVPLTYLAKAFAVDTCWNSQLKIAYFNPTDAQKVECSLANTAE